MNGNAATEARPEAFLRQTSSTETAEEALRKAKGYLLFTFLLLSLWSEPQHSFSPAQQTHIVKARTVQTEDDRL